MPINYQGSGGGVPRKTAKIFGKNAASADMTVFGSTLGGNTVYSTDLDSIQSSRYETGWREAVVSNLNYPLLSDMNAVQHTLSQQIAYTLQHGIPEWDANTIYYTFDKVSVGGVIYTCLLDNQLGVFVTDTNVWAVYYDPATIEGLANVNLSNLTAYGEKHFLNKTQISNCILEAPNGIYTTSGNNVILKQGLKYLIPNGRNADGTLNNIEVTLSADVIGTVTTPASSSNRNACFVTDQGVVYPNYAYEIYTEGDYPPVYYYSGYALWYDTTNNLMKFTSDSGTTWTNVKFCHVLNITTTSSGSSYISAVKPQQPLKIYTSNERGHLSAVSFPSNYEFLDLPWSNTSPTNYVAPENGYVTVWRQALAETDWVCLAQILNNGEGGVTCVTSTGGYVQDVTLNYLHVFLPIQKGTMFALTHRGIGTVYQFRFIYAKGEE